MQAFEDQYPHIAQRLMAIYRSKPSCNGYYFPQWFRRTLWKTQEGLAGGILKAFAEITDVGRNDPCPCGSGKKYKKCSH